MAKYSLQLFNYNQSQVRSVIVNHQPWFVASDVCEILDIANVSQAMGRLDEDEKGIYSNDTPGGNQDLLHVSESGLYSLVLGSRKPEAKPFKRWITHEVIPAIRKTGKYEVKSTYRLPPVVKYMTEADPLKWTLQFTEEYYRQLERLTGLVAQGNKRPARWGQLTNKLVYQYLPEGVADALRDYRDIRGKNEKLHQFFSEKGFDEFKAHMERLLILMQSVGDRDIDHLIRLLDGCVKRQYQLYLF